MKNGARARDASLHKAIGRAKADAREHNLVAARVQGLDRQMQAVSIHNHFFTKGLPVFKAYLAALKSDHISFSDPEYKKFIQQCQASLDSVTPVLKGFKYKNSNLLAVVAELLNLMHQDDKLKNALKNAESWSKSAFLTWYEAIQCSEHPSFQREIMKKMLLAFKNYTPNDQEVLIKFFHIHYKKNLNELLDGYRKELQFQFQLQYKAVQAQADAPAPAQVPLTPLYDLKSAVGPQQSPVLVDDDMPQLVDDDMPDLVDDEDDVLAENIRRQLKLTQR